MPRGISTQVLGGFKTGMDRQTKRGGRDGAQRLYTLENAYLNERGDAVPRPGLQHVANVANSAGLYGWQGQLHVFHGESDFVDPGNPLVAGHWVRYPYVVQPLTLTGAFPALRFGDSGTLQYVESGGVPPYGPLAVTSGALPPWAIMDGAGVVTYTVTSTGTWVWSISGQDADSKVATLADSSTVASELLMTWNTRLTGMSYAGVVAVQDGIIVTRGSGSNIAYSTNNGLSFVIVNGNLGGFNANNITKFENNWYAFSNNVTASSSSGNTFSFTAMSNPPNCTLNTANVFTTTAYPNGALYLGAYNTSNSSILRMNTPGSAWTKIDTGFAYGDVISMIQIGSLFFFVCASGKILKSTDLVVFALCHDTGDVNLSGCAYLYSANVLVVTNSGGGVYRSADLGITWAYYPSKGVQFITATRQEFIGARLYDVLKSTDGITWTVAYTNNSVGQQSVNVATDGNVAAIGRIDGRVDVGTL